MVSDNTADETGIAECDGAALCENRQDSTVKDAKKDPHEATEALLVEESRAKDGVNIKIEDSKQKVSRWRTYKDLFVLSFSFTLTFTAFQTFSNLQSSINKADGIGTTSLAILYAVIVLASVCLPPLVLARASYKWTMVVCIITYALYMATGFYTTWATIVPGAVIIGLGKYSENTLKLYNVCKAYFYINLSEFNFSSSLMCLSCKHVFKEIIKRMAIFYYQHKIKVLRL